MWLEQLVLWFSVLLLGYTYVGYPLLMWLRAMLRPRPVRTERWEPTVSVLIVAYNEAATIAARIENLLGLHYPKERLEIIVASDGSTDDTVARARSYEGAKVRVVPCRPRRGKAAVLNEIIPQAGGEIVVFTDARQSFDPEALTALAEPFGDPTVGAVSGELMLLRPSAAGTVGVGCGLYWQYEKFIRRCESRVDSTVGATGAIYAVRRRLFEQIPDDTILDDVMIPLQVVRRGFRVVFQPAARAFDRASTTPRQEFVRKARTLAGNFQLFARETWLLAPWRNRLWFQTISHKGLRLLTPLLLAVALGANLRLEEPAVYRWMLGAQLSFYASAALAFVLERCGRRLPLVSVPYTVCLLSLATIAGFVRFLSGRQPAAWERHDGSAAGPVVPPASGLSYRRR